MHISPILLAATVMTVAAFLAAVPNLKKSDAATDSGSRRNPAVARGVSNPEKAVAPVLAIRTSATGSGVRDVGLFPLASPSTVVANSDEPPLLANSNRLPTEPGAPRDPKRSEPSASPEVMEFSRSISAGLGKSVRSHVGTGGISSGSRSAASEEHDSAAFPVTTPRTSVAAAISTSRHPELSPHEQAAVAGLNGYVEEASLFAAGHPDADATGEEEIDRVSAEADEYLRVTLGWDAFNRLSAMAAKERKTPRLPPVADP